MDWHATGNFRGLVENQNLMSICWTFFTFNVSSVSQWSEARVKNQKRLEQSKFHKDQCEGILIELQFGRRHAYMQFL